MLCPIDGESLEIWIQIEGYTWCQPPLTLACSDLQMRSGALRNVEVRARDLLGQEVCLYLHVERSLVRWHSFKRRR